MADADVGDLAALLGPAQGIGESEVGMPDHAEHVPDAEGDQGFDQHVGDRPGRHRDLGQRHIHPVRPFLDGVARYGVGETLRR